MKVRYGFVTNSSSTSFILAVKPSVLKESGTLNKVIQAVLDCYDDIDTSISKKYNRDKIEREAFVCYGNKSKSETFEEFLTRIKEEIPPYSSIDECDGRILHAMDKGYDVYSKAVGNYNSGVYDIIMALNDKDNFIILNEDFLE